MIINKITKEIIFINVITNGIIYTVYENSHYKNLNSGVVYSEIWSIDKDIYLDSTLTFGENELKLAYEFLLAKFNVNGIADYEIIQDEKAWLVSDRNMRLSVENEEITKAIAEGGSFNDIILRLRDENSVALEKFIFNGKTQTVIYINSILDTDGVVIGEKVGKTIFVEIRY
jgi:hypothetical protein